MTRLTDRLEIQDVLYRYCRGVDRLDLEMVVDCYFPDAVDHHGGYVGDAAGLARDIQERHRTIDSSQHFVTNVLVDFTGDDSADVESYCLCYLRQQADPETGEHELSTIRCRYVDRFERRGEQWRIADRIVVFDEVRTEHISDSLPEAWVRQRRDAQDPVYAWEGSPR